MSEQNDNAPIFDLDIDNNMNATLIIECTKCQYKSMVALSQTYDGQTIKCNCGISFVIKGDDLKKAQQSLDNFKSTLNKLR